MAYARMYLVNTDTGLAVQLGAYRCGASGWEAGASDAVQLLFTHVERRLGRDVYWPDPHYVLTGEGILAEAVRLPDVPVLWQLSKDVLAQLPKSGVI